MLHRLLKIAAVLTFFATALPTHANELVGEWTLSISSPRGMQHPVLVVEQTDTGLSGVYHSARGPLPISTISFDGSNFSFPLVIEVPIGKIEVNYRGIISGNDMQGLVQNPRGQVAFSGTRN